MVNDEGRAAFAVPFGILVKSSRPIRFCSVVKAQ